jgi:CubicO group peptidase (beta-lactamase class C family)
VNTNTKQVDAIFAQWDKPDTPGCVLGIIKEGELIYTRGYGMANLDYDIPINAGSVFRIASMSKQFTAACILLLAQRGELSLDDNLRQYVPEIPDYGHTITLRHLIHHTSGLRNNFTLMNLSGQTLEGYYDNEDMTALMARQKALDFRPGDEHVYCNSGYVLLAEIVKRISGQSLKQFAQENIFTPLSMNNTQFADDHTRVVKNRVTSYGRNAQGGLRRFLITDDLVGPTGLLSTATDLYRWDQNFYHAQVGGPEFVAQMLEPGRLNNGKELHYASGLALGAYRGLRMVWHGGKMFGFRSQMIRFPQQAFSVICLSNQEGFSPARRIQQVADIYLAEAFPEPKAKFIELPASTLEEALGVYGDESIGFFVEFFRRQEKWMMEVFGSPVPVAPVESIRTKQGEMIVLQELGGPFAMIFRLQRPATGEPWFLDMEMSFHKPPRLFPLEIDAPDADRFTEYVGAYTSDELQTTHKIILQDNSLRVRIGGNPATPLRPGRGDFFRVEGGALRFTRDEMGQVTGLTRTGAMARNIHFKMNRQLTNESANSQGDKLR